MKHRKIFLLAALLSIAAFDNTPSWKMDDNGALVLKDGNPVYLDTSGAEMVVDHSTLGKLRGEAKSHREEKEALQVKLKAFEGIDPEVAKKSIETVGKLDAKQLIDAGEVDKVRAEISGQFTTQLNEKDTLAKTLQSTIDTMKVDGIFSQSEFVRNNIAVPQDMFKASFKEHFKVEDGKIMAYGKDGNKLLSKSRAGEYATPEEALQLLVEMHPQKDVILKANDANGSGSNGGGGVRTPNGRTITRKEFDAASPAMQADYAKKAGTKEITIVD